jgi:hypothetical protein
MKRDVIYLAIIGVLISVIWLNIETMAYTNKVHKNELNRLTDSLSKANGLIKLNRFKWPSEL